MNKLLTHRYNEYYITMPKDCDLETFEDDLDKLVEDDESSKGIISDYDFNIGEDLIDVLLGDTPGVKEVHLYLNIKHDTIKGWERIGKTLNMSNKDLVHAKTPMSKTYSASMDKVPEDSLFEEPWPNAKPVRDYDGDFVTLSRLEQLGEDNPQILSFDYGDDSMLFYMTGNEDLTDSLQKIEHMLLTTAEG